MYRIRTIIYTGFMALLLFGGFTGNAQGEKFTSQPDSVHRNAFVVYISGGFADYISNKGIPAYLAPQPTKINGVATVRILWHPKFFLRAGLETGWVSFYKYSLKDSAGNSGKVIFTGYPLLLEWSMAVSKHFNIFAGSGAYWLYSQLNYAGKSSSRQFSVGWVAAVSYILPLSENTGIGSEAKWFYASGTGNGVVCLQAQFVWKFLK